MSESAKVRLVRCPKCENLLPEVTEFSLYQCGGCGAVLRAKNKGVDLDTFSEKSDEERILGTMEKSNDRYEKMSSVSERRMVDMSDGSDRYEKMASVSDRRMVDMSDGSESDVRSTVSSSSRAERRRISLENNRTSRDEKWDLEADVVRLDELHRARIAPDFDNLSIHDGSRRSGRVVDGRFKDEDFWRAQRIDAKVGPMNVSRSSYDVDGSSNVGEDRAELLRKLDELQDQIRRSGDLGDKGKEKIPFDMRMPRQDPYGYDSWFHDERNMVKRPGYPPPMMHRQETGGNGFYPPRYPQGYMLRRGPSQGPIPYQSHAYSSGPYMDDGMGYMEPYPTQYSRHHPSCSCYQCQTKRRVSPPILSSSYSNVSNDYHDTPGSFYPPHSRSHSRWPSDVPSEVDGFVRRRPVRAHLAAGGKSCRPVAGGAPFVTCNNCFELLLLPKKVLVKNSNRKKLRCGGCSTVIAVSVSNESLVVSYDVEAKEEPVKVDEKREDDHPNQAKPPFSSDDYDNSGYDFHSMDRESGKASTHQERASHSNELRTRHSTSTYASEVEEDAESLKDSSPAERRPAPPAGSSLQDYFEYSNKFRVAKGAEEGNRSGRSELDKVVPIKAANRQMLRKESSATEIDLSSNEYSNTGTTFDSSEPSREGFFSGIRKKSYKDSQKSKDAIIEEENANANVTVNGHLISDRLIKKAEKIAGQIHPGHYWYDFRAGFWGAVGGPCLGIVPPFIEEFNYPMPENCACGNTGVFVNGRELNHKDMNLLGSRGLPLESDRSYIIEISGRVLDEDTGEELESLGKLAPTVERMKRGFGMRAPRAVS